MSDFEFQQPEVGGERDRLGRPGPASRRVEDNPRAPNRTPIHGFEQRWRALTAAARSAPPRTDNLPFGLAARVLAAASIRETQTNSDLWLVQAQRALAFALALLVLGFVINHEGAAAPRGIRPPLEVAVPNVFLRL